MEPRPAGPSSAPLRPLRTRSLAVPALAFLVMMGLPTGIGLLLALTGLEPGTVWVTALGEMAILAVALAFAAFDRMDAAWLGFKGGWKAVDFAYVPLQVVGHFMVAGVVGIILTMTGLFETDTAAMQSLSDMTAVPLGQALLHALVIAALAGFCEEVAFRGYLIPRLEAAGLPAVAAALLSALAFAAMHFPAYGILPSVPKMISFGIPIGLYFVWRRSLWPAVAAHFLVDFTGLGLLALLTHLLGGNLPV